VASRHVANRQQPRIARCALHPGQSVMTFLRIVIPLQLFVLRMIFSENRYPLFGIMRYPSFL
jgi:hypothetical protein